MTPEGKLKVTQNLPKKMPPGWGITEEGLNNIKRAVAMSNTKHGMFAAIPILCKARDCVSADTCPIYREGLAIAGDRCPIEIAAIMQRFDMYMDELHIKDDNIVDLSILKNLVDIEIQLLRVNNKIALDGDFIDNVVAAISNTGEAYYKPELSKASEYQLKLIETHGRLLSYLHATRKDKASDKINMTVDASNYAVELLKRKEELDRLREANTIDVEVKEV